MLDIITAIVPLVLGQCRTNPNDPNDPIRPISVTQYSGTFFSGSQLQQDCFDDAPSGGGTTVPINLNINTRSVKITSSANTFRIPKIEFVSPVYSSVTVVQVALGEVFRASDVPPTPIAASEWFGGMQKRTVTGSEYLELHLYGGVTGGMKEDVRVSKLYRLDFGKEILGSIECASNTDDNMTVVGRSLPGGGSSIILRNGTIKLVQLVGDNLPSGLVALGGTVRADHGNIESVLLDAGNLTGVVQAPDGNIGNVQLTDGHIGTSTVSATISAWGDISLVSAKSIRATIAAGETGTAGRLKQVITTEGDLAGSLSANVLGSGIPNTLSLSVGRALTATITTTQGGGVTRQAFVNTRNTLTSSAWTGAVTLGGTPRFAPAQRPFYAEVNSQTGGEPLGVVPFGVHRSQCTPVHDAPEPIELVNNQLPQPILVEFYGPIRRDPTLPNAAPVVIERRYGVVNGQELWIDLTPVFTYSISGRTLQIASAQNLPTGCYRVTPVVTNVDDSQNNDNDRTRLLCDQVTGDILVGTNANNIYRFALAGGTTPSGPCVADVDDGSFTGTTDGGVTIDDLLYYLELFEQGVIDADVDDGTFIGCPDQGVTIDDLLYYLYRFEQGC